MQDVFAGRLFKTRGGAVLIGGAAAVLAAILLVVYLHSYRSSVNSGTRPMTVLVAKSLIPKGTSGALIAQKNLYQVTTVPKDQLKELALTDPAVIRNEITVADVFPGQQLTSADFVPQAEGSLSSEFTGFDRAIAIPVDSVHGVSGQVIAGDHVDVYVGTATTAGPIIKLLLSNVLVLVSPGGGGNAVLQLNTAQAARFAFAADNARIWLVLRPASGAKPTSPNAATAAALLAGATPLKGG